MSIAPIGATDPGAQGIAATNANATPPAENSDQPKTSVTVNNKTYDYLDLSPQGRAALAQLGRGVTTSSDSESLGGALAAIMKHYDGIFSPNAAEKTGDADKASSVPTDIRDKIAAFLKEGVQRYGQNTRQSFESLLETKQSRIADTFLSAYRKEFAENGLDAALQASRDAVANMKA
jgi:hypothetical protein